MGESRIPPLKIFGTDYTSSWISSDYEGKVLSDPISAYCEDELNGSKILTIRYPIEGQNAREFQVNRVLYCKTNTWQSEQLMRIYKVTKKLKGSYIEVKAEPIVNDMRGYVVPKVAIQSASSPQFAFTSMQSVLAPYTVTSGWSTGGNKWFPRPWIFRFEAYGYGLDNPRPFNISLCTMLEAVKGKEGSLIDTWGGTIIKDNERLLMYKTWGTDNGYRIDFGLNMTDIEYTVDVSDTKLGMLPYYTYEDSAGKPSFVYLNPSSDTNIIYAETGSSDLWGTRMDLIDYTERVKTEGMNNMAQWIKDDIRANRDQYFPKITIKVDFVHLANKRGYDQFNALRNITLGDTVTVYHPELGIEVKDKIIKTTYNVVTGEYDKLEIGQPTQNVLNQMERDYKTLRQRALGDNVWNGTKQ